MFGFVEDVKVALRGMRKRPGITIIMIATLAVALAANGAVFSLVDALVLRPLSFEAPDELTLVAQLMPDVALQQGSGSVAPANYLDWRAGTDAFEGLVAAVGFSANLSGRELPERVQGSRVTPGYFRTLTVKPLTGRAFHPDNETPGHDRVAVLGYALWARRFGQTPAVVGSTVTINGNPHQIVGVAPQGFTFPQGTEVWIPLAFDAEEASQREERYLTVIGRLAPGKTLADAAAQIAVIDQRLRHDYPDALKNTRARVMTLAAGLADVGLGPIMAIWQLSAALVLLIACVNLANLLLARGNERQRELAVRLALGAPRRRVLRQLLTESGIFALLASVCSLPLAWAGATALRSALPASIARFVVGWERIGVDAWTLAFTVAVALGAALVFGAVPALIATRPALAHALHDGGRTASAGRRRQAGRNLLVVTEVAVALALLVGSALSAQTALRLLDGPQGYDPRGLMTLRTTLPEARYKEEDSRRRFVRELLSRAEALPGVQAAATVNMLPSSTSSWSRRLEIEGVTYTGKAKPSWAQWRSVSPAYFDTMRQPLLEGRGLRATDDEKTRRVAVVSRALAKRHWPRQGALGRRFRFKDDENWTVVVGISGDTIHDWFGSRHEPTVYVPQEQHPTRSFSLAVRVDGDPERLSRDLRRITAEVDPLQPVYDVASQRTTLANRTIGLRLVAAIMTAFAAIALILAVTGVYSLMAYRVSQRTQEIGVRVALGARASQIIGLTLGQAGRLTVAGVGIGLGLAWTLARGLESALVGVLRLDLATFAVFALILAAAGLLAGLLPARRALTIDPTTALRTD